ncbi:hypothetical protein AOXY_G37162 [Acipenser oxyrinchus oxyrinchus]|uniref:Uncharacterized protein n=1 Tax=Acipenser oxyrinchus oxyrinchus TaxID=40147 RepID=A0AAD8FRJ3_ACIOX|nr:hypothetical protein AOXY_G37162 [Acipenser oxyrinchus oxyrinchus]
MDFVTEHKDNLDLTLEVLQQVVEMTDSSFKPLLDVCKPLLELAFGEIQSEEQKYMADEFLKLQNKLEQISKMALKVQKQIEVSGVYLKYSPVEDNLREAIRCVKEIQSHNPVQQTLIDEFLELYPKALDIEDDLNKLYNGVEKESILNIKNTNRHDMEENCAKIYSLFCKGIYALMHHKSYTKATKEDLNETMNKWSKKASAILHQIMKEMNAYLNDFPNKAKADVRNFCSEKDRVVSKDILAMLIEQYDWVYWSVRVFNPSDNYVCSSSAESHAIKGEGYFENIR